MCVHEVVCVLYVYVCTGMCVYVCMCIHVYVRVYVYLCVYVYVWMSVYRGVSICVCESQGTTLRRHLESEGVWTQFFDVFRKDSELPQWHSSSSGCRSEVAGPPTLCPYAVCSQECRSPWVTDLVGDPSGQTGGGDSTPP